jgi:hypothetical protein
VLKKRNYLRAQELRMTAVKIEMKRKLQAKFGEDKVMGVGDMRNHRIKKTS